MAHRGWDCPRCGALTGEHCRTAAGKPVRDIHAQRMTAEALNKTRIRVLSEQRERDRARWLEPSRTR